MSKRQELIKKIFPKSQEKLTLREKHVLDHLINGQNISRNTNKEFEESITVSQRIADKVASFGGSWTFILSFFLFLMIWIAVNSFMLSRTESFDPYPFIFLNLMLSMLAAVQAPIILMSQNRQAFKDRLQAGHDYEVNLKAELEIQLLDQKMEHLITEQNKLMDMIIEIKTAIKENTA